MKKILFIAYFYPPVGGKGMPGSQRTVKFVRYLNNVEKYVLTVKSRLYPEYFSTDKSIKLPVNDEQIIRTGTLDIFNLLVFFKNTARALIKKNGTGGGLTGPGDQQFSQNRWPPEKPKHLYQRIKDAVSSLFIFPDFASPWILPAVFAGFKAIRQHKIDIVFATGMPWSSLIIGWILKKTTGAKLIVDFRDPWVGNTFVSQNKSYLRLKTESWLERNIVSSADSVILNTDTLREEFLKRYPALPAEKFLTLYNGYDPFDFQNVKLSEEPRDNGNLDLCHAGYLYGQRDPSCLLKAVQKMEKLNGYTGVQVHFVQIGEIDLDYDFLGYIQAEDLEDKFVHMGLMSYQKCMALMARCDILVIIQLKTLTQIPSKLYEYICLNKPIVTIAEKHGALGKLVDRYGFGYLFSPHDTEGLAAFLYEKVKEKKEFGRIRCEYPHKDVFDVRMICRQLEVSVEQL